MTNHLPDPAKKVPTMQSVDVGKFTICQRYLLPNEIEIFCNGASDAEGEGGSFNMDDLEKVIADFYNKNF